jgi:protein-tyrosine phosphatase
LRFFFKSKSTDQAQPFQGLQTDLHSHLLPGIDDGSPTLEESLHLIERLYNMGYRRIITTPHIYKEQYPNSTETVLQQLALVREAIAGKFPGLSLDAAAEYFMDEHFQKLFDAGDLLTLPGNYVLFEMSFFAPYPALHDLLFKLNLAGYKPILAHPERYNYYARDWESLEKLRYFGCYFQVNLLSLTGYYGKPARQIAQKLLENEFVDFLGTDMHHRQHADLLDKLLKDKDITNKLQEKTRLNQNLG